MKIYEKHATEFKRAEADLYRAREREVELNRPDPAKLAIQLIALRFLLEFLRMKMDYPKENEVLVRMLDAGIDVAGIQLALYFEGKFEVWRLEQVVDALCALLLRCEAAGVDLGTI